MIRRPPRSTRRSSDLIDFGASIGLGVYYFYKNYPEAKIYEYEANPYSFKYLQSNVSEFGINNIQMLMST